jgi:hypothetical protein
VPDREGAIGYSSFEIDVSQEIEKSLPAGKRHGGIFVPFEIATRTALNTLTTGSGKELVFTAPGSFISYLYSKLVCRALGAEVLDGLQGNIGFPKQTGKVTGALGCGDVFTELLIELEALLEKLPVRPPAQA